MDQRFADQRADAPDDRKTDSTNDEAARDSIVSSSSGTSSGSSSSSSSGGCHTASRQVTWDEAVWQNETPRSLVDGALGSYSGQVTWKSVDDMTGATGGASTTIRAELLKTPSATPTYSWLELCSDGGHWVSLDGTVRLVSSDGALNETWTVPLSSPNGDYLSYAPAPCVHTMPEVAVLQGTLRKTCPDGHVAHEKPFLIQLEAQKDAESGQLALRVRIRHLCSPSDGGVRIDEAVLLDGTIPLETAAPW